MYLIGTQMQVPVGMMTVMTPCPIQPCTRSVVTHIADDVSGGLGRHNWDGIASQVVAFLLCFFIGKFIQSLQKESQG